MAIPCPVQSPDNMSIDPGHDGGGEDDEDGDDGDDEDEDDHQEVELKVSFLMIPNGMQPPAQRPVSTISVGNRQPSAQKIPPCPTRFASI